jgi:tetratricopeptide (TPR) repeat protein
MRHAVVVAPPRLFSSADVSAPAAPDAASEFAATLARSGYRVAFVATTHALGEDFARALSGVRVGDDLLVYLAASTTASTPNVTVRVGEDRAARVALRSLSDAALLPEPASVLFVIEARHDGDPEDPVVATEHVDAIVRALAARTLGFSVLAGVRPERHRAADAREWPFTDRLLRALADPGSRDGRDAVPVSLLYQRLCGGGDGLDQVVQSHTLVCGPADFVIVESPAVVRAAAPASWPPAFSSSPPPPAIHAAPPAARAREPSLPPLEPLLDLADGARARGAWEEALAGYKAALMVATYESGPVRASIYARIGEAKLAQAKPREAELNFEKALAADPTHRLALDALLDLAVAGKEPRRAIELRRKRLRVARDKDESVAQLVAIARAYIEELGELRPAAEALEEARAISPAHREAFELLLAAYEKLQRWHRIVDVLSERADITEAASERSALRFAAADVALGRLRDEDRSMLLLERALQDDPAHDRALQALAVVRASRGEWQALDATYARLVDRFARQDDALRAWDTCRKLGALRRDKTRDLAGAIEAFAGAVNCKPADVESRTMLAEMHLACGDEAQAIAELERIAQHAPTQASAYARLFAIHRRAGRVDRAWLAGMALEELGAADMDQQIVADQYRLEGPIRPTRALDDASWDEMVRAPGADQVVAGVLAAVVDAAAAAQVEALREARKIVVLDPARRQSAASTVSAVRSFYWAAQILGVKAPDLFVLEDVPAGIGAVQAPTPSTALGPDVLRGLTTKDLAFLAGRHLTYYRREHYALVHYPTLDELSTLFLAAVKLAMPELPVPAHLAEAVGRVRKALARHVRADEKERLASAVQGLEQRDGRVDLAAWVRSVELTAQRAGLLLCGDLRVAAARLRNENRTIAELGVDERRADLLSYCVSEKLSRARVLLGLDVDGAKSSRPVERQAG